LEQAIVLLCPPKNLTHKKGSNLIVLSVQISGHKKKQIILGNAKRKPQWKNVTQSGIFVFFV
jgi:hypothetical protein